MKVTPTLAVDALLAALYAAELAWVLQLLFRKRFLFLLVWPVALYGSGPLLAASFADLPMFERYLQPEFALMESLMLLAWAGALWLLDRRGTLSRIIEAYLTSPEMRRLAESWVLRAAFFAIGLTIIPFQVSLLTRFGGIFSGRYTAFEWMQSEGLSWNSRQSGTSFGLLAGLYEFFYALTVILTLNSERPFNLRRPYFWMYVGVMLLRLAGGTRLIVVKEAAALLFMAWTRGKVSGRAVIVIASVVLLAGNGVALLRAGGATNALNQKFGPLFAAAAESEIVAMTESIALDTVSGTRPELPPGERPRPLAFLLRSPVPAFLYNVFGDKDSAQDHDAPYNWSAYAGYDTPSPVGGMGFMTSAIYFVGDPLLAVAVTVGGLVVLIKLRYPSALKSMTIAALVVSTLNFWHDPLEISLKVLIDTVLLFYALELAARLASLQRARPAAWRAETSAAAAAPPVG